MAQYTYYCLGCNKKYETDKYYSFGWICVKCREKNIKLILNCCECGKEFYLSWSTYEKQQSKTNWRCKECNLKYLSDLRKRIFANKTPEEKAEFSKKNSIAHKKILSLLTKEEMIERMKYCHEGRDKYFKNPEFKNSRKLRSLKLSISNKNHWKSASQEEHEYRSYLNSKYWANMDEEEKRIKLEPMIVGNKKRWKMMSTQDFISYEYNRAIKWNSDISKHLKTETNTEEIFKNILYENNIKYILQWYNITSYPYFNKLFPYNPYLNTNRVSPFHKWDFLIQLIPNHKIFIDIDGSMHNPNKPKSFITSNNQYLDLQRPYQTDNNQAYIILAYNDKIDNKILVLDLKTGFKFSFNSFIDILLRDKKKLEELHQILNKGD